MFSVGERIKQRYISDCNIHNNMPAEILCIREINYYPNGDYSIIEKRHQALIEYANGDSVWVILEINGCGILSPFEKC